MNAPFSSRLLAGHRCLALSLLAALVWLAAPQIATAGSIEREFVRHAAKVIDFCKDKGYKNVGVLKFRVKKGDAAASDAVGPLNLNLAQRLEIALVLAIEDRDNPPILLLKDANADAAKIEGANHLDGKGLKLLFEDGASRPRKAFHPAWGKPGTVAADAFVSGIAKLSDDLKKAEVVLYAVAKDSTKLSSVAKFEADVRLNTMVEAGESFVLRGALAADRKAVFKEEDVLKEARTEKTKLAKDAEAGKKVIVPLKDPTRPVDLEILYDDKPIPYEIVGDKALIPEPKAGQAVAFRLVRRAGGDDKFGVVLSVNGLNTLNNMERKPADLCRKWILEKDDPPILVKGFHIDNEKALEFRIASPEESLVNEKKYGEFCGQIGFTVYREGVAPVPPKPDIKDVDLDADVALLDTTQHPKDLPQDVGTLQTKFREESMRSRGLIEAGNEIGANLRTVSFKDPGVVMSAVITYYKPRGR